jgi:pimeloyl-ACP methyl ester carboxylesterase
MKHGSPTDRPSAIKEQRVTVAGQMPVALAYAEWEPEDAYKGTVVAIHGLTRQKHDFDFVAGTLARNGYKVLAVDVPGRGGSKWLADTSLYNLDFYADTLSAFLKALGLSRVHWLGTSMGGLIALRLADKGRGQLMRSLTLVDITHKPHRPGLERIMSYVTEDLPSFTGPAQYLEVLRKNLPLGDTTPDYVWERYAEHQLKKSGDRYVFHFDPKIARRAHEDFKSALDLSGGMKKIDCPIALVAGGRSDICTQTEIDDAKALQPGLVLHVCPDAGHVPALADAASQQFIYRHISNA